MIRPVLNVTQCEIDVFINGSGQQSRRAISQSVLVIIAYCQQFFYSLVCLYSENRAPVFQSQSCLSSIHVDFELRFKTTVFIYMIKTYAWESNNSFKLQESIDRKPPWAIQWILSKPWRFFTVRENVLHVLQSN